jgi:hypothetical protein
MVSLKIQVKDGTGNPVRGSLSLSVKDRLLSSSPKMNDVSAFALRNPSTGINNFIQEGISIKGILYDTTDNPLKINVLGGWSTIENQFFYTKSNDDGAFVLRVPSFFGRKPIQFVGYQNEEEQIRTHLENKVSIKNSQALTYSKEVQDYMQNSRQRKMIYQLYTTLEAEITPEVLEVKQRNLEPDATYETGDYDQFKDLGTFFKELSSPLSFKKKKDGTVKAQIFKPTQNTRSYHEGNPLFIVDGKITRDAAYVSGMDMLLVERVDLYYRGINLSKSFSAMGGSGVVVITTKAPQLDLPQGDTEDIFEIHGLQEPAEFPSLDTESLTANAHQPFLRPLIYWNPMIELDENGSATISYHQSDDISDFAIEVIVRSESGDFGKISKTYSVQF